MSAAPDWLPTVAVFPPAPLDTSIVLLVVAAIVLLRFTWAGWRSGAVRQLVSLLGLGLAIFIGFTFRKAVIPMMRPLALPDAMLGFVAAAVLATVIYIIVLVIAALLLRKTGDQEVRVVRLGYGVFGAVIGFAKGVFFVWAGCILLRVVGTAAAVQVALAPPSKATHLFAEIENVVDQGELGALLDRVDPVPSGFRRSLPKLARVLSDDEHLDRFHEHPQMRKLVNHPKMVALQRDPELARALEENDLRKFIANPRVQAVFSDPELQAIAKGIDLEVALDQTLRKKGAR